jgi:hypothetical protein
MITGGVDDASGKYMVTQRVHSVIFIGVKGSACGNTECTDSAEI